MKKVIFKNIIVIFILFLFTSNLVSCSLLEDKTATNTVTIGFDSTFVPMGFENENGDIVGFDIDLAYEAFQRLGLNIKFQPIEWSMKETELINKNIDVIWNGYSINEERKSKVAFTHPYITNKQVIVVLSNSDIHTKEDLKNKNVATQNGSSSLDSLIKYPELVKSFKGNEPILFDSYPEAFIDLEAKRSDAIIIDEIVAKYYINKRGTDKYRILADTLGSEFYSIGLRKSDTKLLNDLNNILDDMKNDGTISNISKKWFGNNIPN